MLGIQVLAAANREALAIAHASVPTSSGSKDSCTHVADEGVIESCAGDLLRYRSRDWRRTSAGLRRHQEEAQRARDHGGRLNRRDRQGRGVLPRRRRHRDRRRDGEPASPTRYATWSGAVRVPVLVGSGIRRRTWHDSATAHGFIVGSSVKQGGVWCNPWTATPCRAWPARSALESRPVIPSIVLLGNLLVDDVVLPTARRAWGRPVARCCTALLAQRCGIAPGVGQRPGRRLSGPGARNSSSAASI